MPGAAVAPLLVVGSVALDSLRGGRVTDELGGSAVYFALAACRAARVRLVAPVGRDAEARLRRVLDAHPEIDASGLAVLDAPTYRWFADVRGDHNVDLGSQDVIYDRWSPALPPGWDGWAFIGSMRPDRQQETARALAGCGLLAADAMRSYVEADPTAARAILRLADWYFCNEDEFRALGGQDPGDFRRRWGLTGLVLKRGPAGASAYVGDAAFHRPAVATRVVDTTGAGDALAGGMLSRWSQRRGDPSHLGEALQHGLECAAVAISDVGVRALARVPAV
jgi:sugar/nucleoside kinase (ribokinase family)